jgi:hypothetical protein
MRSTARSDAGCGAPLDAALLAGAIVLVVYLLSQLLTFGYGRDQATYAIVAKGILEGKAPYADVWDVKTPGIFFVYAAARVLFGSGERAVRILEAAGIASLLPAFWILSRRFVACGRAGLLGGAIAVLAHAQLEFWQTAQPEAFGAILLTWALVASTYEPATSDASHRRREIVAWAIAGVLYGSSALLKPHLGVCAGVSLGMSLRRQRSAGGLEVRPWSLASPALAIMLGAAVPILGTAFYLAVAGAWSSFLDVLFGFLPHHAAIDFDVAWSADITFWALERWMFWFSPFYIVGLPLLFAMAPASPREREGVAHILGVLAILLIGLVLQGKLFLYHFTAGLPLTSLLVGWGLWKLWVHARSRPFAAAAFGALLAILGGVVTQAQLEQSTESFWTRCRLRWKAQLEPASRAEIRDRLHTMYDMDAGTNRQVAKWLSIHTAPKAAIFIWGFEPGIYLQSGREPASRYVHNHPLRVAWDRERRRRELLEDLRKTPPAAIVVVHGDPLPWVTGNSLDSAAALREFPELLSLIESHYSRATSIGDFEIYVPRDLDLLDPVR